MAGKVEVTWTGDKDLIKKLSAKKKLADNPTRMAMLEAGGAVIQQKARENVAKKLNKNSKGALSAAIIVKRINQYAVSVGPVGIIYAAVHEFGAVITPKRAKALRFVIEGKVIFAQYVKIPARPYMRPAVRYGKQKAMKAMTEFMRSKIES